MSVVDPRLFSNLERFETLLPEDPPDALESLSADLKIYSDSKIDIWYAPMGSQPVGARVWILGITPGWQQMQIAYQDTIAGIRNGMSAEAAIAARKPRIAFAGSMRRNLVSMLDEVGLPDYLDVASTSDLFGSEQLRTGSVLRYPVMKHGRNYTGHSPAIERHPALREMIHAVLAPQLEQERQSLIIPLGKSVEAALGYMASLGYLDMGRVLTGFPHPSGANGHRKRIFEARQVEFTRAIRDWF